MTFRISEELAHRLQAAAKSLGLRKSDVARMAISRFLAEEEQIGEARPYEQIRHLIGSVSSGMSDLGERHRDHLLRRLRKHA